MVTRTEVSALFPCLSMALPRMVCVPFVSFFFCHVTEHVVTFSHVVRVLSSPVIVIDAMPMAEFAETAMLTLPFGVDPFVGELIATLGDVDSGAVMSVVTDTLDDWLEVLPAASKAATV